MLAKFSVKKPYFIYVLAIIVLILGGISISSMKTDLLPDYEAPYLAVITTDPGASPEQVQTEVSEVLEGAVGTVSGVKTVNSMSYENYSMIFLEFTDDTDMDSALVKVSAAVNQVSSQLPDSAGTPTYMQMNMDMMATMYLGATSETLDIAELTKKVNDEIVPALQRVDGVANVTAAGFVSDAVEIRLNQTKIDNVNAGILGETNEQLAEAKDKLDSAERELDSAEKKIKKQQKELEKSEKKAFKGFNQAKTATNSLLVAKASAQAQVNSIDAQIQTAKATLATLTQQGLGQSEQAVQTQAQITQLEAAKKSAEKTIKKKIDKPLENLQEASSQENSTTLSFAKAESQLSDALANIESSRSQLEQSKSEYKTNAKEAREKSNIDAMLDASTLSQLISAQNFEMPAGYVDDANKDDKQWVVKVGEKYTDAKDLKNIVLTKVDGVGDITLGDVANVVATTDEGESYAKVNGNPAIILPVSKASTANTSEVSHSVQDAMDQVMEEHSDVRLLAVMDQGKYIDTTINTILTSLLLGALLAFVVLAIFLRNWRPTIIVAFSIPFSVLCALVVMYFCGLSINMMTLGAMSLAIGMLVDNSIVTMENIYRMRARGLSAPRAAAQGALQVTGAIVASTITSICVFFPFVFADGTVRQLMVPFALTLSFALIASLVVAITVVPAIGSKILEGGEVREAKWFEGLKNVYERALGWALDHRAPVMTVAIALLGVAVVVVARMGIVMIPDMVSEQITLSVAVNEELDKEDGYNLMDVAGERIVAVDGIADVGVVDEAAADATMSSDLSSAASYNGSFYIYATVDTEKVNTEAAMQDLNDRVVESVSDLDAEFSTSMTSSSMSSMSGSDASVAIKGTSAEGVQKLSDKVVKAMKKIDGYEEVENGQEDADETLHITINKDKVARMGTTVGQVYQQISDKLNTSTSVMTLSEGSKDVDVNISTEKIYDYTNKSILNMEFTDGKEEEHKLKEVAKVKVEEGVAQITRENQIYTAEVTAKVAEDKNVTLLARDLQPELDKIDVPNGYSIEIAGINATIIDMMEQMIKLIILGFVLLYLVMVAQFQNLKSPFIILFTVPLAFTGGLLALAIANEQLSLMAMLGLVILMGTVVNNGIVFVDYANQMRLGGMEKRAALIATGRVRMRPILMTALTTIISMCALIFSQQIGSSMERGMALVVAGGLLYATFMTLFIVPIIYDFFNRKPLKPVDIGSDVDNDADDAAAFIAAMGDEARETHWNETRKEYRARRKAERAERIAKRKEARRSGQKQLTYGQRMEQAVKEQTASRDASRSESEADNEEN